MKYFKVIFDFIIIRVILELLVYNNENLTRIDGVIMKNNKNLRLFSRETIDLKLIIIKKWFNNKKGCKILKFSVHDSYLQKIFSIKLFETCPVIQKKSYKWQR